MRAQVYFRSLMMQSILLFTLLITLYPLACLWLQPANNNKRLIMYNWLEIRVKNDHRSKFSNLSNWKIYCDDHSSLSSTTAVQKWIISYTSHHDSKLLLFYDKVNPLDYSKIVLWGRVFGWVPNPQLVMVSIQQKFLERISRRWVDINFWLPPWIL